MQQETLNEPTPAFSGRESLAKYNGRVTVKSLRTGDHRTFAIRTERWTDEPARVVSLLDGPDNESDYTGFGFIQPDGSIRVWLSKRSGTSRPSTWEQYARILESPQAFEGLCEYHLEARCRRCGRTLTTPESIESGIGPVCAGKEEGP